MLKQQREDPLKESLDKLANSVSGLEETLSRQKTLLEELVQRSYAVEDSNWKNESAEIKSEIISLKGLFLSRYFILFLKILFLLIFVLAQGFQAILQCQT